MSATTGNGGMRFVDEYRSGDLAKSLADQIAGLVEPGRHYKFMEVCGGHTHTIYKHGVEDLLPDEIELVHGPGCPVCVIPMGRIDDAISIARAPGGDLHHLRRHDARAGDATAPCSTRRHEGADVRMVYSPLDALKLARENPDREVVFFAIGFETTAPSTALTAAAGAGARASRTSRVFCNHVTIIPAIRAILDSPDLRLDGFIGPGPRLHRDRPASVPLHRARLRQARGHRRASSRSTSSRAIYMILRQLARGPLPRSRTSTAGWCRERGQSLALEAIGRDDGAADRPSNGAASASSPRAR